RRLGKKAATEEQTKGRCCNLNTDNDKHHTDTRIANQLVRRSGGQPETMNPANLIKFENN
ncbi:hypothetical protein A2U01_0055192, partial [Trifolium medium]|nr:hypothetical protein [Trifolium medium]